MAQPEKQWKKNRAKTPRDGRTKACDCSSIGEPEGQRDSDKTSRIGGKPGEAK